MAYYKQSFKTIFSDTSEDSCLKTRLAHYKTIILEKIVNDSDPNDRHIKEWTDKDIKVKKILKEMETEGLITIQFKKDKQTVRRYLVPTGKRIYK